MHSLMKGKVGIVFPTNLLYPCSILNKNGNLTQKFTLFTLEESSPELKPLAYEKMIIMNGPDDDVFSGISSKYSYGKIILDSPNIVIIMGNMFWIVGRILTAAGKNHKANSFNLLRKCM